MAIQREASIWTDAQGENVLHVVTANANPGLIRAQLETLSNAAITSRFEGVNTNTGNTPVVATYPTVRVTARLFYRAPTGSIATLYIPAPQSSIFLSDGVTVDPSAVATLNSTVFGVLIAGDSTPVTQFQGGELWQQKITGIASLQAFTPI